MTELVSHLPAEPPGLHRARPGLPARHLCARSQPRGKGQKNGKDAAADWMNERHGFAVTALAVCRLDVVPNVFICSGKRYFRVFSREGKSCRALFFFFR